MVDNTIVNIAQSAVVANRLFPGAHTPSGSNRPGS
jgi:hypothetical protein